MDKLISAQAVIDALTHKWNGMVTSVFDVINSLPSAQPERKTGKWIPLDDRYPWSPWYQCSECGAVRKNVAFMENYCPNCGARLVQEGEDNE